MEPPPDTLAGWSDDLPAIASRRSARRGKEWAAYYDDLQQAFARMPDALSGRKVVLDSSGELRPALGIDGTARDVTLFFLA